MSSDEIEASAEVGEATEPTVEQECAALVAELAQHGVPASYDRINPLDLRTVGWLAATSKLLIERGFLSQDDLLAEMWVEIRGRLRELLIATEKYELEHPKPTGPQVLARPPQGLLVPGRGGRIH